MGHKKKTLKYIIEKGQKMNAPVEKVNFMKEVPNKNIVLFIMSTQKKVPNLWRLFG